MIHYKTAEGKTKDFVIKYDPKQLQASVEKISLGAPEDKGVIRNWGDNIYRINFTADAKQTKTKIGFVISAK